MGRARLAMGPHPKRWGEGSLLDQPPRPLPGLSGKEVSRVLAIGTFSGNVGAGRMTSPAVPRADSASASNPSLPRITSPGAASPHDPHTARGISEFPVAHSVSLVRRIVMPVRPSLPGLGRVHFFTGNVQL
jgi:hypothetical protein